MTKFNSGGKGWLFATIVCLFALSGCNRPTGNLSPPTGWTEEKIVTKNCPVIVYLSPQEGPTDPFRENICFITEDLATFTSLEAYVTANKRQAAIGANRPNILEETETTLGGIPARRLVYTHSISGIPLKTASYFIVESGTGFCISCCTTIDQFEEREPDLRRICETFKIIR